MNQNNIQQNSSGFNNQALSQQSQSNTLKSNPTFGNQNSASKNVSNQQQIGTLPQQENPDQFKNQQSNNIDSNIGTVDIGFSRRRPSARQKQSQEQTMNSINTPLNRSQTTFNQQGGVTNFNNTAGLPPQPQQKFDNSKQIDINNAQRQGKRGGMLDQENDQK
ncbi:hypothetical protein PPERSA_01756 [Pseudocohnilembus persalinus]|uniref:Uncharacterized protein n=1 Tax=Pseudocohnilembus persalinus TaxID=266149 RepID=A0A0V0R184_PSEPJ|nr:hypothetical protein PPERSA_01756 [Pseudocohnilembus persalinus]|eukprot:KRX08295.1 hypothetical protein PPERSA_01756 [Pseudocohnilembus persalinus]